MKKVEPKVVGTALVCDLLFEDLVQFEEYIASMNKTKQLFFVEQSAFVSDQKYVARFYFKYGGCPICASLFEEYQK